jgi:PadR family transcriptional regulator PadR
MNITAWKSQLRKGAAELAVLAVLSRAERYGLQILDRVAGLDGLEISEGTIYPLLNRLQRDGKIESTWIEEDGASHPRKYYRLTEGGARFLAEMKSEWNGFSTSINRLLEEDDGS